VSYMFLSTCKINNYFVLTLAQCQQLINFNMLSLQTWIKHNSFRFIMESNYFVLLDLHTQKKIDAVKNIHGLLILEFTPSQSFSISIHYCNSNTYATWHRCLGHVYVYVYKIIAEKFLLSYVDSSHHYSICYLTKQIRLPFNNQDNFNDECFYLVHVDVWVPFKDLTHDDCCYFLTIIGDKSRLIKNKFDYIHLIPKIFSYVET